MYTYIHTTQYICMYHIKEKVFEREKFAVLLQLLLMMKMKSNKEVFRILVQLQKSFYTLLILVYKNTKLSSLRTILVYSIMNNST